MNTDMTAAQDTGMDKSLPYFGLIMTQDTPADHPVFPLPEGYAFSSFRAEYILAWARLQTAVGQMENVPDAVRCFIRDFLLTDAFITPADRPSETDAAADIPGRQSENTMPYKSGIAVPDAERFTNAVLDGKDLSAYLAACPAYEKMRRRVLFLTAPDGTLAATGALWDGDTFGEMRPLLHWIAADPQHQGKGLGKALLSGLFDLYDREGLTGGIYLITQTWSPRAVRLYMRFGFAVYPGPRPKNWAFEEKLQDPAAGFDFEKNMRTVRRILGVF